MINEKSFYDKQISKNIVIVQLYTFINVYLFDIFNILLN
jgi:hypothetical protein